MQKTNLPDKPTELLTTGFNYIVKSNEMSLSFFCDCCGHEVKVSNPYNSKKQERNEVFNTLKEKMDGKFHRCFKCGLLVCESCWENREIKCAECPICVE